MPVTVFNFTHPHILSALLWILSASRFLASDSPLSVPATFVFRLSTRGMTFLFLSGLLYIQPQIIIFLSKADLPSPHTAVFLCHKPSSSSVSCACNVCVCMCVCAPYNYCYHYYFQCYLNITVYQSFWHHHLVYQLPRSASQSCQSVLPQSHCQSVLPQSHCLVYHCSISITVLSITVTPEPLSCLSLLHQHHCLVYQSYLNIIASCISATPTSPSSVSVLH